MLDKDLNSVHPNDSPETVKDEIGIEGEAAGFIEYESIEMGLNQDEDCIDRINQQARKKKKKKGMYLRPDLKTKTSSFAKRKKIRIIVSKVLSVAIWCLGICLLALCISNLYQQVFNPSGYTGLFGIGEAVVASNSMEPKLYANDLIFYKEVESSDVEVEDIIVYEKTNSLGNSILIVHKVVDIKNGYVTTQGINNAVPDESFPVSAIVGKYMFKIGQAGRLLNVLSTPYAPLLIILLIVVVFAIRVLAYYFRRKRIIHSISIDDATRTAIDHFFDI